MMKSLGNNASMTMKKKTKHENEVKDGDDSLNLLHSDLSSLLHRIDVLVVKAFKVKSVVSNEGRREIESFSNLLSDTLSRLKPWVPRLQIALSSSSPPPSLEPESKSEAACGDESNVCDCDCDSPQEITLDSLVSPSPLVSWRANCTIERGRQMFMLTPLPLSKTLLSSKKPPQPPPPKFELASSTNPMFYSVVMKPTPAKHAPSLVSEEATNNQEPAEGDDTSMLVMMTPCLKMSPPKSCVLLEPISEMCHMGNTDKLRKCTPFPVGVHYSDSEDDSESPGSSDASQGLALKYPELLGIQQQRVPKSGIGKKTVEASPPWLTSPPKTCVLLGTPDEKSLGLEKADNDPCVRITKPILKQLDSKLKDGVSKDHEQAQKTCNQDHFVGNLSRVDNTPMWKEPKSSLQTGKRPGENTLKKELWTKFEEASTCGFQPKLPTSRKNSQKGFLDLLEEASYEE